MHYERWEKVDGARSQEFIFFFVKYNLLGVILVNIHFCEQLYNTSSSCCIVCPPLSLVSFHQHIFDPLYLLHLPSSLLLSDNHPTIVCADGFVYLYC